MRTGSLFLTATVVAPLQFAFGIASAKAQSVQRDIWSGYYLGATAGAGAGAIFGSNWSLGTFIIGSEVDGQVHSGRDGLMLSAPTGFERFNWSGAARVRAGFAIRPTLFVYGLAGAGISNMSFTTGGGTVSGTRGGLQLGAGVEWKLLDQLSLRVDYTSTRLDWGSELSTVPHDRALGAVQVGVMFRF